MSGRFKIIFLLAQFLLVVLLCACSDVQADAPGPSFESIESFVGVLSNAVQNKDRDRVFRDTITPPNNPMNEVPYVPGTHYFRGVLQLEYFYNRSLFCVIRSTNNNNYFLTDNGSIYLIRLNHPLLSEFAVGDTVVVTAKPMMVKDSFSLATYHILPNTIFK